MPDTIKSIVVVAPATLVAGASASLSADVTLGVPDSAVDPQSIVWTSANPAIATVTATPSGASVKAIAPGVVQIRAAIGAVVGLATVTISMLIIDITAAQEAALKTIPVGGAAQLKGPTIVFDVTVTG